MLFTATILLKFMTLTNYNKNYKYAKPTKNAKFVTKIEPADNNLRDWTSRHNDNEYNSSKLLDCQCNENLTESGGKGFFGDLSLSAKTTSRT